MAHATRVRVELKKKYNDPHKNFKEMFTEFKRRVSNAGIMHDFKEHQFFESKSEKQRKKRKAAKKKLQMELLEDKIQRGERVTAPAGLVKKAMSNQGKGKKKKGRQQNR